MALKPNKFSGGVEIENEKTIDLKENSSNGSNKISLKAPASLSGDTTYTLPEDGPANAVLQTDASGTLSWTTGVGSGGINYITNYDAATDTTGWATYDDGASADPVDGTSGSPSTLTFTRNTSSPLRGTADFDLAKSAADGQGEGVSYDFTIDSTDQAKILRISFDYTVSADYADDDMRVQIYDVTNSAIIQTVGRDIKATSLKGKHIAEFQTAPNSTSYRLILHVSSTNASAYQLNFDNVEVGPREIATGSRSIIAEGKGNGGGSVTANTTNIDFTETLDNTGSFDGTTFTAPKSGSYHIAGAVAVTAATGLSIQAYINGSADVVLGNLDLPIIPIAGTVNLTKGDALTIRSTATRTLSNNTSNHHISITSVGGNAEVSTDFGNRIITAKGKSTNGQTVTNGSPVIFETVSFDTTASYDNTTGFFTVPESGFYRVSAGVRNNSASSTFMAVAVDGSAVEQGSSTSDEVVTVSTTVEVTKGQTISIENNTGVSVTLSTQAQSNYFLVEKIQSPQTLIGSETVAAKYNSNSAQSIPNVTDTVVNFEDNVIDTHGAVTTGSSWAFTAPVSGIYKCSAQAYTGVGNNWDVDESFFVKIRKNSTDDTIGTDYVDSSDNTGRRVGSAVDTLLELSKGDTVDVVVFHSYGSSVALDSGSQYISFSIHKI